jgi:hypothetical protein
VSERLVEEARRKAEAWRDLGIHPDDEAAKRTWLERGEVYGPGSPHSYFRDFIADWLDHEQHSRAAGAMGSLGQQDARASVPLALSADLDESRKRLATVETRDVSSADPGAASFLGPGFIGSAFNTAARAEGTLAAALGLKPLPQGVKQVNIPRFDTGFAAGVVTEGSAVTTSRHLELARAKAERKRLERKMGS